MGVAGLIVIEIHHHNLELRMLCELENVYSWSRSEVLVACWLHKKDANVYGSKSAKDDLEASHGDPLHEHIASTIS